MKLKSFVFACFLEESAPPPPTFKKDATCLMNFTIFDCKSKLLKLPESPGYLLQSYFVRGRQFTCAVRCVLTYAQFQLLLKTNMNDSFQMQL